MSQLDPENKQSEVVESVSITLKEQQLQTWVAEQLGASFSDIAPSWAKLKGDAGFRQYFRLRHKQRYIAVNAPPETEDSAVFIKKAIFFSGFGVHTPKIYHVDLQQGFLLVEDLGTHTLYDQLIAQDSDALYAKALITLSNIQACDIDQNIFPEFDTTRMLSEMALFCDWFVPQLLDYEMNVTEQALVNKTLQSIVAELSLQPRVIVHLDYHSQNIMSQYEVHEGSLGVVDFQDSVWGPVTYDLVSLLKDCYIAWSPERIAHWRNAYLQYQQGKGELVSVSEDLFTRWFDWMGLQRHIKVLGIFARLSLRDNKHKYLQDLGLVIHYVREVLSKYPELSEFKCWFEEVLMPVIVQQEWWQGFSLKIYGSHLAPVSAELLSAGSGRS